MHLRYKSSGQRDEELASMFQQPPQQPKPTSLLENTSYFQMGHTAQRKIEAAKEAQKKHRIKGSGAFRNQHYLRAAAKSSMAPYQTLNSTVPLNNDLVMFDLMA